MSAALELLRAAQEGDRDACEQAVIENNGLIWSVVRRYYGRGVDPDDLDQLGKISIKARILEGNVLELTVRDWGRGIPDVDKARQPLYTTGGEERSGMGFTIMESFMDALTVRSGEGKGTRVTMRRRIVPRRVSR